MDEGILFIQWDTGYVRISPDNFFPCSMERFKKLLKIVDLDWEHADGIKADLKVYFQNQISIIQDRLNTLDDQGKEYKAAKRNIQSFNRLLRVMDARKK